MGAGLEYGRCGNRVKVAGVQASAGGVDIPRGVEAAARGVDVLEGVKAVVKGVGLDDNPTADEAKGVDVGIGLEYGRCRNGVKIAGVEAAARGVNVLEV